MESSFVHLVPNPRNNAGFFSKLSFWWLLPLLRKAQTRPLEKEDLYSVQEGDESAALGDLITRNWDLEKKAAKKYERKPKYIRALIRSLGCDYFYIGFLVVVEECFTRIMQPLLLGRLIRCLSNAPNCSIQEASSYAVGITLCAAAFLLTHHPLFYATTWIAMRARISTSSIIYRKSLRLSRAALGASSIGQMVNLLSNDVDRFRSLIYLHYLWAGPVQITIVTCILWQEIGPSCLAGLGIFIFLIPLQSWMGKTFSRLRLATAHGTDERVRIMNEITRAIRVIKMYAWQKPFEEIIKEARKKEIDIIMTTNYYRSINLMLYYASAKIIVFLALLTYVLTGNILTAEKVFVSTALIHNLRLTMTLYFHNATSLGSEMLTSCSRIEEYLLMEEREESDRVQKSNFQKHCSLDVDSISASWTQEEEVLSDVTFKAKAGDIIAIIGQVGAGKSSILQAILEELPINEGSINISGRIAYASQEPWVFSGSVRQNILFGLEYNAKKYKEIIRVCALDTDLAYFPQGDHTMVGERGAALSGGQKARISLARAVYYDADIYLLDDPLSAVDASVGQHLYEKCFTNYLKHKVRILVTHQIQHIKNASEIIILSEGRIAAKGPYNQLINKGVDFGSLLSPKENEEKETAKHASFENRNSLFPGSLSTSPFELRRGSYTLNKNHETLADEEPFYINMITGHLRNGSAVHDSPDDNQIDTNSWSNLSAADIYASELSLEKNDAKFNQEEEEEEVIANRKMGNETKSTGSISSRVYLEYVLAGGGWIGVFSIALICILAEVLYSCSGYWLAYWTNEEARRGANMLQEIDFVGVNGMTNHSTLYAIQSDDKYPLDRNFYLYTYTGIIVGLFLFSLWRSILFLLICMRSSRRLHDRMFTSLTHTTVKFFDTHPIGQILNRFTKDMGQVDDLLPVTFYDFLTVKSH